MAFFINAVNLSYGQNRTEYSSLKAYLMSFFGNFNKEGGLFINDG